MKPEICCISNITWSLLDNPNTTRIYKRYLKYNVFLTPKIIKRFVDSWRQKRALFSFLCYNYKYNHRRVR